jgi:hypothetical protein
MQQYEVNISLKHNQSEPMCLPFVFLFEKERVSLPSGLKFHGLVDKRLTLYQVVQIVLKEQYILRISFIALIKKEKICFLKEIPISNSSAPFGMIFFWVMCSTASAISLICASVYFFVYFEREIIDER